MQVLRCTGEATFAFYSGVPPQSSVDADKFLVGAEAALRARMDHDAREEVERDEETTPFVLTLAELLRVVLDPEAPPAD